MSELQKDISNAIDDVIYAIRTKLESKKKLPENILGEVITEQLQERFDKPGDNGERMILAPALWKKLLDTGIEEYYLIYMVSELMGYMVTKKKVDVDFYAEWPDDNGLVSEGCVFKNYFVNDEGTTSIFGKIKFPKSLKLAQPFAVEVSFRIKNTGM